MPSNAVAVDTAKPAPPPQPPARVERIELIDMLRQCREQFAFYGRNHRAKVPDLQKLAGAEKQIADTEAKAAVNEEMVRRIDRLLEEEQRSYTCGACGVKGGDTHKDSCLHGGMVFDPIGGKV